MARIFFALSTFAVVALLAQIVLGLMIGDYNGLSKQYLELLKATNAAESPSTAVTITTGSEHQLGDVGPQFQRARQWKNIHFLSGVFSALVTLLVNAIAVTYFIGTSRWCREVAEAYGLGEEMANKSTLLKRKTFPWSVGGILTVLTITALGAASDPGGSLANSANFVMPHFICALVGTAFIAWSFWNQTASVGRNHELIEEILTNVKRIRRERGLDEETVLVGQRRAGE